MLRLFVLLPTLGIVFAQPLFAESSITVNSNRYLTPVVELYTSEGCSSCPPADNWLAKLVDIPASELNVLALAFHVDYWDYIGWKDEFAHADYTARQRRLANQNRQSTMYTPEFFVDGRETRGTARILEKIQQANNTLSQVDLELTLQTGPERYSLQLKHSNRSDQPLTVQFVVFEDDLSNQVERGENAGRLLQHQRVVRYLSKPLVLDNDISHNIHKHADWKPQNVGIGALVSNGNSKYMQSVYIVPGHQH